MTKIKITAGEIVMEYETDETILALRTGDSVQRSGELIEKMISEIIRLDTVRYPPMTSDNID